MTDPYDEFAEGDETAEAAYYDDLEAARQQMRSFLFEDEPRIDHAFDVVATQDELRGHR